MSKTDDVDESRREDRIFVGICYTFVYPYQYKVILKWIPVTLNLK